MKTNPYLTQLLAITVSFAVYTFILSFSERTSGQYETRNVLLQAANFSQIAQVVDNRVESLNAFYTSLLEQVELHRLPYGYTVKQFYFKTKKGKFDLLALNGANSLDIDLAGDAMLVLLVYNRERQVYGESSCLLSLNASNVWELSHSIVTFVDFGTYDVFFSWVICGLLLALLLNWRNKYTYALAVVKAAFLALEFAKRFLGLLNHEEIRIMRYLNIASSLCLGGVFMLIYKIQVDILSRHNVFHLVFYKIFNNATFVCLSLLLVPFLHYLGVHILYWFIWAPTLQCVVTSAFVSIVKQWKEKNLERRRFALYGSLEEMPDGRGQNEQSSENAKQSPINATIKRYCAVMLVVNLAFTVVVIICCFKTARQVDSSKAVYNGLIVPFKDNAAKYVFADAADVNKVVLRAQVQVSSGFIFAHSQQNKEVQIDVRNINSLKRLKGWLKAMSPPINALRRVCLVTERNDGDTKYQLVNMADIEATIGKIGRIQVTLLWIFQISDTGILYSQLDFGQNHIGLSTFEDSAIYSLNAAPEYLSTTLGVIILLVVLLHLYRNLKDAKILEDKKKFWSADLKVQSRVVILALMTIVGQVFVVCSALLNARYLPEVSAIMGTVEGDLDRMAALLGRIPVIRHASEFSIFMNAVLIIFYVITMLPRYYYSFTKNGEVFKRSIVAQLSVLGVVVYQYAVLLVSWSLMGNRLFGDSLNHFRSFFTSLRYNMILGFNRVLVPRKNKYIDFYNNVATLLFYNIGLTALLAVYYCYSRVQNHKTARIDSFDENQDNFKINITASLDDIVSFKVFIKSVEEHKKYIEANQPENDQCKLFFERFPQDVTSGVTQLNPKTQVHMYVERIKKYMLCIIFLRMKIRNLSLKLQDVEELNSKRNPINQHKRSYLLMLKQKLRLTVEEIERFRRSTEILVTGKGMSKMCRVSNGADASVSTQRREDPHLENLSQQLVYDEGDLEGFIMKPLSARSMVSQGTLQRCNDTHMGRFGALSMTSPYGNNSCRSPYDSLVKRPSNAYCSASQPDSNSNTCCNGIPDISAKDCTVAPSLISDGECDGRDSAFLGTPYCDRSCDTHSRRDGDNGVSAPPYAMAIDETDSMAFVDGKVVSRRLIEGLEQTGGGSNEQAEYEGTVIGADINMDEASHVEMCHGQTLVGSLAAAENLYTATGSIRKLCEASPPTSSEAAMEASLTTPVDTAPPIGITSAAQISKRSSRSAIQRNAGKFLLGRDSGPPSVEPHNGGPADVSMGKHNNMDAKCHTVEYQKRDTRKRRYGHPDDPGKIGIFEASVLGRSK